MFSYYSNLCTEVYDLTKPVGHSVGGDIEYYLDRLQSCSGRILEAAVGSGRMLIPLLEAELVVDGLIIPLQCWLLAINAVKSET